MDDPPTAYPRPASLELRVQRRGCRNCIYFDNDREQCRQKSPFPFVRPTDWCGEWKAAWNPRIGWESAFAGCELSDC